MALPGGAQELYVADGLLYVGPRQPDQGAGLRIMRLLPVVERRFLPQLHQ